jgi:hypothetical protein
MHCVSRTGPKPLEGLLRGKERGSTLDSLGLACTMHARYSYQVWWGVMLPEEVRTVIGEWCGECLQGLCMLLHHRPPGPLLRCVLWILSQC